MEHPNPEKHLKISLIKSVLRIVAAAPLLATDIPQAIWCGLFLIIAEIFGVLEEVS
jgi:hypothetical protein